MGIDNITTKDIADLFARCTERTTRYLTKPLRVVVPTDDGRGVQTLPAGTLINGSPGRRSVVRRTKTDPGRKVDTVTLASNGLRVDVDDTFGRQRISTKPLFTMNVVNPAKHVRRDRSTNPIGYSVSVRFGHDQDPILLGWITETIDRRTMRTAGWRCHASVAGRVEMVVGDALTRRDACWVILRHHAKRSS